MNLCGGIVNLNEKELLLDIPNNQFAVTPTGRSTTPSRRSRRSAGQFVESGRKTPTGSRAPSASRSSSRGRSRQSGSSSHNGSHNGPSEDLLNPISKDDLKQKSRSRNQRSKVTATRTLKLTSGLIKKLEQGIEVMFLVSENSKRRVKLDLDSERRYLRIRSRGSNRSDNENDGAHSNHADISLKIKDMVRLEIGKDKMSKSKSTSFSQSVACFSVVSRHRREKISFNFEADSADDRDVIISVLSGLMDQFKYPSDKSQRKSSSSTANGSRTKERSNHRRSSPPSLKCEIIQTPKGPGEEGLEASLVYFDFDASIEGGDPAIEAGIYRPSKHDRAGSPEWSSSDDEERISRRGASSRSERYRHESRRNGRKNEELALTVAKDQGKKELGIEVAGNEWSVDDFFCGLRPTSEKELRKRIGSMDDEDNTRRGQGKDLAIREMNNSLMYDTIACRALGCQSEALAAVEDVELAAMANEVTAGPFCTDEVCSASLRDFTDTMKGIFEMKQKSREGSSLNEKQRAMTEDYITGVLGAPNAVANLLSVKEMWNTAAKRTRKKNRILNRAGNRDAQALRWTRLRQQMTFHSMDQNQKIPFAQVVTSFDDVERSGRKDHKSLPDIPQIQTSVFLPNSLDSSRGDGEDNVLYYDSDPEFTRESYIKRGPRKAVADLRNVGGRKHRRSSLSGIPSNHRLGMGRRYKKMDEEVISEIIETMKNEKMALMWHPTQTDADPNRAPECVKVWIESGTYLVDGTFLLPKLTWLPIHEKKIDMKVLNVSKKSPESLDLLDVCRVRECDAVDRRLHPFASCEKSFVIQTQNGIFLFEAQSKQERGRIVNGLKLVIARLASLLMLRDLRAVDEFFGGNAVPGEAPTWATGKPENAAQEKPQDFPSN